MYINKKRGLSWIKKAIDLYIIPEENSEEFYEQRRILTTSPGPKQKVTFTWEPISFLEDTLHIKIEFPDVFEISKNIIQDNINVQFLQPELFYSLETLQPLDASSLALEK